MRLMAIRMGDFREALLAAATQDNRIAGIT